MFRRKVLDQSLDKVVEMLRMLSQLLTKLQDSLSGTKTELFEIAQKLDDSRKRTLEEIELLRKEIQELLVSHITSQETGVHLLVDGDNVLHRLSDLERRLDWKKFLEKIEEVYGKIRGAFFFANFVPEALGNFISQVAGFDIVTTSFGRPSTKDLTDSRILRYIENIPSPGSRIILFTEDRSLRRKAGEIAQRKHLQFIPLFFDSQFPHSVRDTNGNFSLSLFLPRHILPEALITPNLWEEALERFLEEKYVNPEKVAIDHFLLVALRWLFSNLPSSPKREGERFPRSFIHLAKELLEFLRAYQPFSPFPDFHLSEADTIAILDALLTKDLLRKAKIGELEVCYRALHQQWKGLRKWLPRVSEEA